MLPSHLTEISDDLRCPISQDLLLGPVKAADGHAYSGQALQKWFSIRKSSPLNGTLLQDTSMTDNDEIARAANEWVEGQGLITVAQTGSRPSKKRRSTLTAKTKISFDSVFGGFERTMPEDMNLSDPDRLAFRGLNGRHSVFQLVHHGNLVIAPSSNTFASLGFEDEGSVTIRIADETDTSSAGVNPTNEMALVKVYRSDSCRLLG